MRNRAPLLFLTVLIIAISGLVYELIAGAIASYILGDSVTQFSTTIGVYLFAMGVGSYLSRYVRTSISIRFIEVELALAFVGGFSAWLLFWSFAFSEIFSIMLYGTILVVGTLVGLEIPLLMRILKEELDFEELIAKVLSVDYLGSLAGSLLFALVLVPNLGLNRTSLSFGLLNCVVAMMSTTILRDLMPPKTTWRLRIKAGLIGIALTAGFINADHATRFAEQAFYADPIVYAKQTPYQRIVLTQGPKSVQLFLNGNLQFSSSDEYRYHEALVHPAFAAARARRRVLILGGGDGLALREVYRYPEVESVTLVDLDPGVTEIARELSALRRLNQEALDDPRTTLVHADAMVWLTERETSEPYDVVVIDFPDPNNFSLGKLYTRRFYRLLRRALHSGSAVAVQSTSPLYARRSFWCVERTMAESGFHTAPYHATVPSFGVWGFVLAMPSRFEPPESLELSDLRFLNRETLRQLFEFSEDMSRVPVDTNRLNDQRLVHYYQEDWSRWN